MNIYIKPDTKTLLHVSKALSEYALDATTTQLISAGEVSASWTVNVAQAGEFLTYVSLAAPDGADVTVTAGAKTIKQTIRGTKGYFPEPKINFERFLLGSLYLDASEIQVSIKSNPGAYVALSSIDLHPKKIEDVREEAALAAKAGEGAARAFEKYASKGFGMMFHWTAQSYPKSGERKSYESAVSDFDTERFADQVKTAGASYVFLTVNHAIKTFPAPLSVWEDYFPGYTTKRDLIADLYESLKRRDIDLMLYLNFTAAYIDSPYSGIEPDENGIYQHTRLDISKEAHYTRLCVDVFTAIGERYGDKIKGYWIDSCYQLDQQFDGYDFRPLYEAAKIGNPDRLVSFNFWVMPLTTPWNDYWAGETARYADIPCARLTDGPAAGQLNHQLFLIEEDWGCFTDAHPIPEPFYTAQDIASYAKKAKEAGTMLTINAEIYQEGILAEKSLDMLRKAANL